MWGAVHGGELCPQWPAVDGSRGQTQRSRNYQLVGLGEAVCWGGLCEGAVGRSCLGGCVGQAV